MYTISGLSKKQTGNRSFCRQRTGQIHFLRLLLRLRSFYRHCKQIPKPLPILHTVIGSGRCNRFLCRLRTLTLKTSMLLLSISDYSGRHEQLMRSVWLTVIPVFLFCIVCLAVVVLQMPFIKPFLIYAVSKSWLLQVRRRCGRRFIRACLHRRQN